MIGSIDYHKYLANFEITNEPLNFPPDNKVKQDITIKSINVEAKEIVRKKASKEKSVEVSESLLDFGTRLHYALELLDYKTKDLSYIKDYRIKKYVSNVINSFVFENMENAKVLNEYRFYDEATGVNGIIDCLLIKEDEVDIVDFKLKNISDVHYNEQLNIYADYVKKICKLPIKKYLISAITGEVREVE
jgi:ATP-dependent exoDNAse (exonuclease V) beta subunit